MKFINTLNHHRKKPNQSLFEYYRNLRCNLSELTHNKKIIYLDTKFWILLRDGLTTPQEHPEEYKLLLLARELIRSEKCVFPISEDVFIEVLKQTDIKTLLKTVEIIDELSLGITTLNHDERVQLELFYFFYAHQGKSTYRPSDLVWTKLSYSLGFNYFSLDAIPDSENLVIQKAFLDHMWSLPLKKQVEVLLENGGLEGLASQPSAENINKGKFQHMHEASSFKQLFLNELAGWIDCYRNNFDEISVYMYESETGNIISQPRPVNESEETKKLFGNAIYNLFKLNKIGDHLPTARITSGLFAAVRWDKKQKFQDNDLHDFRHACAALPYCDFFFTEKRLTHLLTQKILAYDKLYSCMVFSKLEQAIATLESIKQ